MFICEGCNQKKKFYAKNRCRHCWAQQRYAINHNNGRRVIKNKKLSWLRAHKDYTGNDCLIFPFARQSNGYGQYEIGGERKLAHRAMCRHKNGPAPKGKPWAAHTCGNGHLGCVNPNHLVWKSPTENSLDRWNHGTIVSILTEQDVRKIKRLLRKGRHSLSQIGDLFNVSSVMIFHIKSGRSWSHVN